MTEILNKAKELQAALWEEEIFKDYFALKDIFENDSSLKTKREEIARLKLENNLTLLKEKQDEYFSHPIVHNFYLLEEEVKAELLTLKDILEK